MKFANVRTAKNKRGCIDRYEVVYNGRVVATFPVVVNDRPDARTKALDYARMINQQR